MNKIVTTLLSILSGIFLLSFMLKKEENQINIDGNLLVLEVLISMGHEAPFGYIKNLDSLKIKMGEELVLVGYTKRDGINSKRISKHFVCISCHNVVSERPNLQNFNQEERLKYMKDNKIPFLPGSSLFGVVNRENYFSGDYVKKFGTLAIQAKDTLSNAIQLCAEINMEGRKLEQWETESIMHYLYSIQYKISDLNLKQEDQNYLLSESKNLEKIKFLKSKYLNSFSSTFGFPQSPNIRKLGKIGNRENGEYIFQFGCMHCHHPEGITIFTLENDHFNRKFLRERMLKTNNRSIYEITRNGTQPKKLNKSYMPFYTYERLSDEQLEDLAAFLNYKP